MYIQDHQTQHGVISLAMLIDDEPVDQMLFERAVNRSAFVDNAVAFTSAQDALDYLGDPTTPQVDVVFLDVNMPRMSGLEFLAAATARFGPDFVRSCVVMLTTELTQSDRKCAEEFDVVQDFFNKPLTLAHFENVAERLHDGDMR